LFAHKTGILPQPLPSGSSSKYLGKQMNILPDDHRVEYVTVFPIGERTIRAGLRLMLLGGKHLVVMII
uniref:hypothetical protein n=1 Tax=Pectobacterium sp. HCp5_1 TaxID=3062446 RepID=UPI00293BF4CB